MSVQWADDFSRYGLGLASREAMLNGLVYSSIGTDSAAAGFVTVSPDPSESVPAFRLGPEGNTPARDFRVSLPTVVTGKVGCTFRAWLANLPIDELQLVRLCGYQRLDGEYIVYMQIQQNGAITIWGRVGSSMVKVYDSLNPLVQPNAFNHYEMVHDADLGTGEVYINGILRIEYEDVDPAQTVAFVNITNRSSAGIGLATWIKDFVIWDDSGTQNNDVMGTVIVRRLEPLADVTLGGWDPSTGTTGVPLLAKTGVNDATYLSADDTPPAAMKFTLEDLPADVTSVRALITVARARKVDGGDANLQIALSPNDINWDNGADRPITTAFSYYFDVSELDPLTSAPWTPLSVNDAIIRADRTV